MPTELNLPRQLGLHREHWNKLGPLSLPVKQLIGNGFRIPFSHLPPQKELTPYSLNQNEKYYIHSVWIPEMIRLDVIRLCQNPKVINPIFAIPKKDGSMRVIFSGTWINSFIKPLKVRYETLKDVLQQWEQNDQMIKVDVYHAFYHLLIHPKHQVYLAFRDPVSNLI